MLKDIVQVLISATSKAEANKISDRLVKEKIVAGTLITKGLSRYWWEGKIVEKEYYNISAFTKKKNKKILIFEVRKLHSDKCPIIAFHVIDGNVEFLDWVNNTVA